MKSKRIYFIDNLRWICVWLVVLFHVIDIFNSTGVPIHYNAPGIPQLDLIGYFVYPWFMALLFILAGISAKESLKVRSVREFAGNRFSQLMVPFIAYMAIFAIPTSAFCFSVSGGWADFASVPKGVLVIIMLCCGSPAAPRRPHISGGAAASESDSQIINSNDFIAAHFAVFNKAVLSVNLSCAHMFGFI